MKKSIGLLAIVLFLGVAVFGQSIQDGVKALYSGQLDKATKILEKQTNSPEGVYWLARVYVLKNHYDSARYVFDQGLSTNPNAPFLLIGKGFFLLTDKKVNEAKQAFETAITASKGRKGADPAILNAVGRAMTQAYNNFDKVGDINYAAQKLEEALAGKPKDPWLLADIYTNLGDAYRKAKPGEGSAAFDAYQSAIAVYPTFAQAQYRKALIFKSQRNWELFEENMNKAIAMDQGFLPAYYQLYEYKIGRKDFQAAQGIADKIIANSPGDLNNEYYAASTYYLNKNYDEAIRSAKHLIATAKGDTDPKAYKLIAYSYVDKGDTAAAMPFVEEYFKNQRKDEISAMDYALKAMAYSTTPGKESVVLQSYLDGVKADTVLDSQLDVLEAGAKFFGAKGLNANQAVLFSKIIDIKPANKVTINDYFNAGLAYYRAKQYETSWPFFDKVRTKFPDVNYGYLWAFYNSKIFDSTNAKNIVVPDAEKLVEFSKIDKSADAKSNAFNAAYFLANYYNDVVKDKGKAVEYLKVCKDNIDDEAAKKTLQDSIDRLSRQTGATKQKGGK